MKTLLGFLFLLMAWPALAQPTTTVASMEELLGRVPKVGEIVAVRTGFRTNDWGGLREFRNVATPAGPTNTGHIFTATNGTYWESLDRLAPRQDVRWFNAKGDGTTDDAAAINAAAAWCAQYGSFSGSTNFTQGGPTLVIPPIARSYRINSTVSFPTSVDAEGANFDTQGITNGVVVFVGVPDAAGYGVSAQTYKLPNILGRTTDGYSMDTTGVRMQNVLRSEIKLGYVQFVGTAFEAFGGTAGTTLNTVRDLMAENVKHGFKITATNANSYVTGHTFTGMRMNNFQAAFTPGAETGYALGLIDAGTNTTTSINGNVFLGGSWEGFPSAQLLYIRNASANLFDGIRLEHHAADFTPSIPAAYTSRYMEVEGTRAGVGIDNRWANVSQASGLYGVAVKEVGFADGNSGADSRGTVYGSRDQGFFHGGIVLQPTDPLGDNAGSAFTVYPYMAWPKHHETNYTEWTFALNPLGASWKNTGDAAVRLNILRTGAVSLYDGTAGYRQYWGLDSIGGVSWYNLGATTERVLKVDQDGIKGTTGLNIYVGPGATNTARFTTSNVAGDLRQMVWSVDDNAMVTLRHDPATKAIYTGANPPTFTTNLVRPATLGAQGGLELASAPTNKLTGFYHRQRMGGVDSFIGSYHLAFDPNDTDYMFTEIGAGALDHTSGWLRGAAGIAANWTAGSTSSNIVLHTLPQEGRIEMRTGPGFNPAALFDQSLTTNDTRASLWVNNSNAPVRVKYSDATRVFYGGDTPPNVGMAAGGNVTFTTNTTTGVITIAATGGGSGATNGTAVSVNDLFSLDLDFIDGSEVLWSQSDTNVTALLATTTVVAGSYTNPIVTFDSKGRATFATNGVAGGGSGTNYTQFYYDLTNSLLAGSNIVLTPSPGKLTITSTGSITNAPADGSIYGLSNTTWVAISGSGSSTNGVVFSVTNSVTVDAATTAETTLLGNVKYGQSKTISANAIVAGSIYRLDFSGEWSAAGNFSGNTLKAYFGGRSFTFEATTEPYSAAPTGAPFYGSLWLTFKETGAIVIPMVSGYVNFQYDAGNAGDKAAMLLGILSESGAVDTTSSAVFDLTWDNGAEPMSMTLTHAILWQPDLLGAGSGDGVGGDVYLANANTFTGTNTFTVPGFASNLTITNLTALSATVPTASPGDNDTTAASTAFVTAAVAAGGGGGGDVYLASNNVFTASNYFPTLGIGTLTADSFLVGSTNVTAALAAKQPLDADLASLAAGTAMATAITNAVSVGAPVLAAGTTNVAAELALKAPLISPSFTTPTLDAASATSVAIGATNVVSELALKAPSASPNLTGTVTLQRNPLLSVVTPSTGNIVLDFAWPVLTYAVTNNVVLYQSTNRPASSTNAYFTSLRLAGDTVDRTLSWHSSWVRLGTNITTIPSNKVVWVSAACIGTAESGVTIGIAKQE